MYKISRREERKIKREIIRLTLFFSQVDGENKYDNGRVKMIIRKADICCSR